MTTVTFIVPAYNSEETLAKCLDSFVEPKALDRIEVIVVNDGSTDSTPEIAKAYSRKYAFFKLINKINGGHGSTINVAIQVALGKYFKVVDSDDWLTRENLQEYLEHLQNATADVVLTNFRTIDINTGITNEFRMSGLGFGKQCNFEDFWVNCPEARKVCCFHGITYRTEFYRSCGVTLSEGISYDDQEFSVLPFAKVKTALPLDLFLYEYALGFPNQSMAPHNQVKRISHLEKVFWKIAEPVSLEGAALDYFRHFRREILLVLFVNSMVKNKNKGEGRIWAKKLRQAVERYDMRLHRATRRSFTVCLLLSYTGFDERTMEKFQSSWFYKLIGRWLR